MELELRNDHNVYILGAGFSRDRGYPVMTEFLNRMRDAHPWLEKEGRDREAESVKEIIKFRLKSASAGYRITADLENIEELFSLAAATPGGTGLMDHVRIAIAATLDFCRETTKQPFEFIDAIPEQLRCPFGESQAQYAQSEIKSCEVSLYDALVARMCGALSTAEVIGENTIISFNYDTLVEESLYNLKLSWDYGFSDVSYQPFQLPFPNNGQPKVPLYKLHGSVNWAYANGKGNGLTVYGSYSELIGEKAVPELIPPTWRKSFDDQMSEVWDKSVEALRTATRIIIIGFSIPETDMHFKHLLAAGLQDNVSLRDIVFVSLDDSIEERAEKIFRDFKLCKFAKIQAAALLRRGDFGSPLEGIHIRNVLDTVARPYPSDWKRH